MTDTSLTQKILFTFLLSLSLAGNANAQLGSKPVSGGSRMQLIDSGSGLKRKVTVESVGLFCLVFEAADNWGISEWYDLVNDRTAQTNLAGPGYGVNRDISTAEPGLFQEVFYGTTPDDPSYIHGRQVITFPTAPELSRCWKILLHG